MIDFVSLKKDLVPNKDDRSQISQQYDAERERDNADGDLMSNLKKMEGISSIGIIPDYSIA